jgi:hypothetical protein
MLQQAVSGCPIAELIDSVGVMDKWPIFLHSSSSSTPRYKLSVGLVYLPVKLLVKILNCISTQGLVRWFLSRCTPCLLTRLVHFQDPILLRAKFRRSHQAVGCSSSTTECRYRQGDYSCIRSPSYRVRRLLDEQGQ